MSEYSFPAFAQFVARVVLDYHVHLVCGRARVLHDRLGDGRGQPALLLHCPAVEHLHDHEWHGIPLILVLSGTLTPTRYYQSRWAAAIESANDGSNTACNLSLAICATSLRSKFAFVTVPYAISAARTASAAPPPS